MKTTGKKRTAWAVVALLLILASMAFSSCAVRHPSCMRNYYHDVEIGIAH